MRLQAALSKRHLLVLLLACSLAMSLLGWRVADPLRHATEFALVPFGDAPMYARTKLGAKLSRESAAPLTAEEAEKLRIENDYLHRLSAYWQAQSEVFERQTLLLANFQRMYGPSRDMACELIPARVVGAGSLQYDRTRVLSPGSRGGIKPGMPVTTRDLTTRRSKSLPPRLAVVNSSSLVGRVIDSGAFTARLQFVTDRNFQMNGRIRRVIAPGKSRMVTVTEGDLPRQTLLTAANNDPIEVLVVGDGSGLVIAPDVKEYYKVQPGDLLMASAEAENLPVDIHIGRVVKVEIDKKDPRRVKVYVRPHTDVANVRDVFIVSPMLPEGRK